jgi:4-oxalocrotonate tautomerase
MPYVNLQITPGSSRDQRAQIVAEFTDTLVRVLGKRPEHTHIVIQEIGEQHWGFAAILTDEYLSLSGRTEAQAGRSDTRR